MTQCHNYGHYHQIVALDEKPAALQDSKGSQAMIDTPPHGTDEEPCWYCSGTGEDNRSPCPNCRPPEPTLDDSHHTPNAAVVRLHS